MLKKIFTLPNSALVQILFRCENGKHRPVGAGFLVTSRHILTCAHVVNDSLGFTRVHAQKPITPIWLDFPLLLPHGPNVPLKGKVTVWHPMGSSSHPGEVEDIAVLEVMEDVLPSEARSTPLVKVGTFFDRRVRMCGFPGKKDEVDWLSGTLQSNVENGRVQIDTGPTSRPVRPGFSGAPVWESGEDAVAGMIVTADTGKGPLSGYMIPAAILLKACPDLPFSVREPLEPAPEPFLHLRDRFADTVYFPSWQDFQYGRFYFHSDYHQPLERHLAEMRRALIVGYSGSGKTALAYSLGFRFVQEDSIRRVFYTDTAPRCPSAWLDPMRAHDRPEYLFVIDNSHDFPDACNELLDGFGAVHHARLLLVSQPLPKALAGPEDESYLGRLRQHKVELQLDTTQLEQVLTVFAQVVACDQKSVPTIGDKQKLLRKCDGDLHLLKYYFMAWEKQPQRALSDIDESEVLANLHARYLARKAYANELARLGALSQFAISADRRFFGNPNALEHDLLVEQRENLWGDPQIRIHHPTSAYYLALAHVHHTQGRRNFEAWTLGVLPAITVRWLAQLDYPGLAERSGEVGLGTVRNFLQLATQAGAAKTALRAFAKRLNFKALGERSREEVGLATVQPLLRLATQAGVGKTALRAFAEGLNFKALGERSREVGFNSIEAFLKTAYQTGVSSEQLRLFCSQLDWHKLGQSVVKEMGELRNMLFVFASLFRQRSISPDMALQFIEGVGWRTLGQWNQEVFSIDVLAACQDVLRVKCRCESQALRRWGIDFDAPDLWWRSLFRPIGKVNEGQKHLQACYLKDALQLVERDGADELLRRVRTLQDLNILIRNLKEMNPDWLAREVEPRLQTWDAARWQNLFDQADVRNLGTFLQRFCPRDGLFRWLLSAGLRFPLDGKIRQATLEGLAHLLFNFFVIQRRDQSYALALYLEAESGYVQEQLAPSTLAHIELFFWNYWLACPPDHEARLFRLAGLPDSLVPKLGAKLKDEAHWLGLAGSWRMAAAPGSDTIQIHLRSAEALGICRELAAQESPILIRSLIGLSLVCPYPPDADRRLFAEALESTVLPGLNIPTQEQALAYLEAWLKAR